MRLPVTVRRRGVQFDITPLIDVVFNLIIFFLVASHYARSEPVESVQLPAARQTAEDAHPRRLVITIPADGRYLVGAREVSIEAIEEMIAEGAREAAAQFAVRVRGDRETAFRHIEPIMLACARQGVATFGFQVIEESP